MTTTADQVADTAKRWSEQGKSFGVGMCLKFSRSAAGAPGGVYDAATAWRNARYRHGGGTPPRGTFVWWTGGSRGHGHVAVSDGKGWCWSTDSKRGGRVDRVAISAISRKWNLKYVGWSEDINGVRVDTFFQAEAVLLSSLRAGERSDAIEKLQLALRRKGFGHLNPSGATGFWGRETTQMVKAFQASEPSLDGIADGRIGPRTAALLGLHAI